MPFIERIDDNTNRAYYINVKTKETQWQLPPDFRPSPPKGSMWRLVLDKNSDRQYYANVDTRETKWQPDPEWGSEQYRVLKAEYDRTAAERARLDAEEAEVLRQEDAAMRRQEREQQEARRRSQDNRAAQQEAEVRQREEERARQLDQKRLDFERQEAERLQREEERRMAERHAANEAEQRRMEEQKLAEQRKAAALENEKKRFRLMAEKEGYRYLPEEFAESHFAATKGRFGKTTENKFDRLTFTSSLLKQPLLDTVHDTGVNRACQAFKNIMSYMGDRKSSKKEPLPHARKLLSTVLAAEQTIRDEVYAQLMKQTVKNPRADSLINGWRLFCLCLMTFPPSEEIAPFLATYFLKENDKHDVHSHYAEYCLFTLDGRMIKGHEFTILTDAEITQVDHHVETELARFRAQAQQAVPAQNSRSRMGM